MPDVDAATVSNLETATLPYYLVPHQQANAELYKIVLDLATQSLSDKVEEQHEEKEEEGHVENKEKPNEEKHVKNEEKQKEPEDTSYNVTNGTPVTPPRNETAATARLVANRPALNKPVKKPRLIPKLKQSTVDIPRPKIQSPADISELYSNPMFSFAFPERPKQRKHKTNTAAAATTAAIKQEHQPAFCNDDEVKDVEKEKDDQVTTRKRPVTVDSHSTTVPPPRREPKKTKHLTKRTKRKNPPPPPSTPDSIDDHLLPYLPKGVTRRPSGRWVSESATSRDGSHIVGKTN